MAKHAQISDAEWAVMKAIWEQESTSVNDLCQRLAPSKQWHIKTVRTMLIRLTKKGLVRAKSVDGIYHYSATVSRDECTRTATHSFIDRVFDGALAPMVAHFASRGPLSDEERRELKKLLSTSRKKDGK